MGRTANPEVFERVHLKALKIIQELAPGPELVELSTNDIEELMGEDKGRRTTWVSYLRRNKFIATDSVFGSNSPIKSMRITQRGVRLLKDVEKYGVEYAIGVGKKSLKSTQPKQCKQVKTTPTATTPVPAESIPTSRVAALTEARSLLGPDASVDDLLKAASFLAGGS